MPLPSPRDHRLRPGATVVVPVPEEGLLLHRLVEGATARLRDFETRVTRQQADREGVPELFRLCVSHWLSPEQAASVSRRPGMRVARLRLVPGGLERVALTEEWGVGHVDVWTHPRRLPDAVVEVVGMGGPGVISKRCSSSRAA